MARAEFRIVLKRFPGLFIRLRAGAFAFALDERGQDLVEYALVAALISLAAIAGMQSVATAIGVAYTNLGTKLSSYIT